MSGARERNPLEGIEYPDRFHPAAAPLAMALAAALHGFPSPVRRGETFHYCDLGCGPGLGCLVLAAANPEGRFTGIDVEPRHVARAESRAREAGLGNAGFLRADVRDHERLSLPAFDLVVASGLYGWVAPDVRAAIAGFLGSRLRPGGLALVSYNALPGWGALRSLRDRVRSRAEAVGGDPAASVRDALEELAALLGRGAPFLEENRGAARALAKLRAADPRYLAHEFLAPSAEPLGVRDVAADLARAGLEFVGSALPPDLSPRCSIPAGCREEVESISDPVEREALRDIVVNRFFRMDLFRRPAQVPDADPFDGLLLGLDRPVTEVPDVVPAIDGDVRLEGDWFEPLKQLLAGSAWTPAELRSAPELRGFPAGEVREGLRLLIAAGHVKAFRARGDPLPAKPPRRVRIVPELNRIRIGSLGEEGPGVTLASPVSGTGRRLGLPEALALAALTREDPEGWLAREARRHDLPSAAADGREPDRRWARDLLGGCRSGLLPTLLRLGLAEPCA